MRGGGEARFYDWNISIEIRNNSWLCSHTETFVRPWRSFTESLLYVFPPGHNALNCVLSECLRAVLVRAPWVLILFLLCAQVRVGRADKSGSRGGSRDPVRPVHGLFGPGPDLSRYSTTPRSPSGHPQWYPHTHRVPAPYDDDDDDANNDNNSVVIFVVVTLTFVVVVVIVVLVIVIQSLHMRAQWLVVRGHRIAGSVPRALSREDAQVPGGDPIEHF